MDGVRASQSNTLGRHYVVVPVSQSGNLPRRWATAPEKEVMDMAAMVLWLIALLLSAFASGVGVFAHPRDTW